MSSWKRVDSSSDIGDDVEESNDERIRRSLEAADAGEFSSLSIPSTQSMHRRLSSRSFSSSSSFSRSNDGRPGARDNRGISRLRTGEKPSYANNYNRGPRVDRKTGRPKLYQNGRALLDDGRVKPQDEEYEGDHIFGIMPVKAALVSARGRVISEILVQEGMDISNKKDGASVRELLDLIKERNVPMRKFPKHDLNMLVDNKPHQGMHEEFI